MAIEGLGRPKSFTATVGATPLTTTAIRDWDFTPDAEGDPHFSGNARFPRYIVVKNDNTSLTIKTTDMTIASALVKNVEVTDVELVVEGPTTALGVGDMADTTLQHAKDLTCTISCGYVAEAIKYAGNHLGDESEFDIVIKPKLTSANAEPTVTWAFAAGA